MPRSNPAIADGRREQGLGLLASGVPIGEAARMVGVDRKTLARWRDGARAGTPHAPRGEVAAAALQVSAARAQSLSTAAEGIRLAGAEVANNVRKLIAIRDHKDTSNKDRMRAIDLLNGYAGVVRQERVEVTHGGSVTLDVSELRAKIRAAREAAQRSGEAEPRRIPTAAEVPAPPLVLVEPAPAAK